MGCFWHLLPWDSGVCAVTVFGFVSKGPGNRDVTGSLLFPQSYLTLGNWDALVSTPNLKSHIYWLFLTCNLRTRITCFESYKQSFYTLHPRLLGMKDDLQRTWMTSWPNLQAQGLMMGVFQGHKEECGALASRQRWHFALAVTTGKPALAQITASKPWATCLFSLLKK